MELTEKQTEMAMDLELALSLREALVLLSTAKGKVAAQWFVWVMLDVISPNLGDLLDGAI